MPQNLQHLEADDDLTNLRELPKFKQIVHDAKANLLTRTVDGITVTLPKGGPYQITRKLGGASWIISLGQGHDKWKEMLTLQVHPNDYERCRNWGRVLLSTLSAQKEWGLFQLQSMTLSDLKKIAKSQEMKGYSKWTKSELLKQLQAKGIGG